MENNLNEIVRSTMDDMKNMAEVNKIVGEPIVTPDGIVIIPISKLSFAFGGGGGGVDGKAGNFGGGSAAGAKIEPIGFLVVKDGSVRVLSIQPPVSNGFERALDMAPEIIDKVDAIIDKRIK